jgi:hypothetical protein
VQVYALFGTGHWFTKGVKLLIVCNCKCIWKICCKIFGGCKSADIYIYMCVCVCVRARLVCTCECERVSVYVCNCVCVCQYLCMCVSVYVCEDL